MHPECSELAFVRLRPVLDIPIDIASHLSQRPYLRSQTICEGIMFLFSPSTVVNLIRQLKHSFATYTHVCTHTPSHCTVFDWMSHAPLTCRTALWPNQISTELPDWQQDVQATQDVFFMRRRRFVRSGFLAQLCDM